MDIGTSAARSVTDFAIVNGDRQIGYLVHFKRNMKNLEIKAQELVSTRDDLQILIDAARNNNELVRKTVTDWFVNVDIVLDKATRLNGEAVKVDRWYKGWTSARFSLGRKASRKIVEIENLLEQWNKFGKLADPKPAQSFELITPGDFEAFASRVYATKKVLDALQNDEVNLVGIFGMPGVGKTMLMQEIARKVKEKKIFDEMVMVIVSQDFDVGKIQQDIAVQLDLHLHVSTISATQLSERLSKGKRILVALDDVWERLDLAKVGIPYKEKFHGCKVVFTTRNECVCDQMETHEKIEVGVLSEEDSWSLFRQKAGEVVDFLIDHEVARDVLNECKGLPLAIATLGKTLRNKDEKVWLDTRIQLKKSIYRGTNHVIPLVKLSYKFLQNVTAQMCFLFCGLFPEDSKIESDVLLSYILGEKLLKDVDNMEEASHRLHTVIDTLTSSGLLLRNDEGDLMMHDVIRDASISIASDPEEGEGFIVKSGLGLEEWPCLELDKCKRLSLMSNKLRLGLPHQISAPQLLTLSLSRNIDLTEIPDNFFEEMKCLETLDISYTGIVSLPQSFSCLQGLCALRMDHCTNLVDISWLVNLERLEILSMYNSKHIIVPEGMWKLKNLKLLNGTSLVAPFPPKVISRLCRLEELYFLGCKIGGTSNEIDFGFSEVAALTRLTCVEMALAVECLPQDLPRHWRNLSKFVILVGRRRWLGDFEVSDLDMKQFNRVMLLNFPLSNPISYWISALSERTDFLALYECDYLQTVVELNANGSYGNLRRLDVSWCKQMMHLLSTVSMEKEAKPIFGNLEILSLDALENFVAICDGTVPQRFLSKLRILTVAMCGMMLILIRYGLLVKLQNLEELRVSDCSRLENLIQCKEAFSSTISKQPGRIPNVPPSTIFPNLRRLYIWNCNKLKCVLPVKVARDLLQLEQLTVRNCWNMEMIFEYGNYNNGGNANSDKATLQQLKILDLGNLHSLSSFGPPNLVFCWPNLVKLAVNYCDGLKRLPLDTHSVPKLKEFDADTDWLDGLEWEDQSLKSRLQSLILGSQSNPPCYSDATGRVV